MIFFHRSLRRSRWEIDDEESFESRLWQLHCYEMEIGSRRVTSLSRNKHDAVRRFDIDSNKQRASMLLP